MKLHIIRVKNSNRPLFFITDSYEHEEQIRKDTRQIDELGKLQSEEMLNINANHLEDFLRSIDENDLGFTNACNYLYELIKSYGGKHA